MANEIIKVLDELSKQFGIAIDWTEENIIPYLLELYDSVVTYYIISKSIGITITLILLCVFIPIIKKEYIHGDDYFTPLTLSLAIISIPLIAILIHCIIELLRWIFIPEMQIIDYIETKYRILTS